MAAQGLWQPEITRESRAFASVRPRRRLTEPRLRGITALGEAKRAVDLSRSLKKLGEGVVDLGKFVTLVLAPEKYLEGLFVEGRLFTIGPKKERVECS